MSNWTFNQVEQKNDHLGQNDQWLLMNLDISSSWTKQNDILSQNGQWYSSQMGHIMNYLISQDNYNKVRE